jgi:FtsP/CotA-like multicopper oxidase with cupredoxin domain
VDLARVMDSRDIPALLGRAANALEASGVVIWVASGDGQSLVPALTHGYSSKVVSRLGSLEVAADNITSACFRSARPQTMAGVGQPGATSAVAVPLITADGCNGVLAAELRVAKPPMEVMALARIIAAQFAAMVTPAEAAAPSPTASADSPVQAAEA